MGINFELAKISGYSGYFVGEDGNIYSFWTMGSNAHIDYNKEPRKLKGGLTGAGYLHVTLKKSTNIYISKDIHRLICKAFYGESSLTSSHKDGNKFNNKLSNLIYETYSDNIKRKLLHGTDDRSYNNSRAKINKKQLKEIKKLLNDGKLTHKEIGEKFSVNRVFITKINCGHRYNN